MSSWDSILEENLLINGEFIFEHDNAWREDIQPLIRDESHPWLYDEICSVQCYKSYEACCVYQIRGCSCEYPLTVLALYRGISTEVELTPKHRAPTGCETQDAIVAFGCNSCNPVVHSAFDRIPRYEFCQWCVARKAWRTKTRMNP